jgi:hypothetical protein
VLSGKGLKKEDEMTNLVPREPVRSKARGRWFCQLEGKRSLCGGWGYKVRQAEAKAALDLLLSMDKRE